MILIGHLYHQDFFIFWLKKIEFSEFSYYFWAFSVQHHDSSLVEGRLIMQMVVAESSARARQLLNLPPRPSADRPMEEGDQGMGEGLLQCSVPIRPVGATISPANVGLGEDEKIFKSYLFKYLSCAL